MFLCHWFLASPQRLGAFRPALGAPHGQAGGFPQESPGLFLSSLLAQMSLSFRVPVKVNCTPTSLRTQQLPAALGGVMESGREGDGFAAAGRVSPQAYCSIE